MTTNRDKKFFRTIGHQLNPVVMVGGNGITEAVITETERALADHELIKIRVNAEDKAERVEMLDEVTTRTNAELIQLVGGIALLYRKAAKPNKALSNIIRFGQ